MGTPLGSSFRKGGIKGRGSSKNISTVAMAAKTPTKVTRRVLLEARPLRDRVFSFLDIGKTSFENHKGRWG